MTSQAPGHAGSEPLLTKAEVAELFKVSEKTVTRWVSQGAPHMRVGHVLRLRRSEVEQWIENQAA